MEAVTVGVDIAKAKFDAAVLSAGKYRDKRFENTPDGHAEFLAWLKQREADGGLICLEATGAYSEALALFLHQSGLRVSVVNPAQPKAFGAAELARTKTDRSDARLLARFAAAQRPEVWMPAPPNVRKLQALLRRLESLREMQRMEQNRQGTADAAIQPSIQAVLKTLHAQIAAVEQEIQKLVNDDPDLRQQRELLDSIPGIGDKTAAYLMAADLRRFEGAKQAAAFAGLCPREHQSGTLSGKTHLSKTGNAQLRHVLYFPALSAWRGNTFIRVFCARLKANGKNGKAIAAAAMHKLLRVAYGVLKSGLPFDPAKVLAKT